MTEHNIKLDLVGKKLIADLRDKKEYKIHYMLLKLVIKLGYVLTKIHVIVQFEQEAYLKNYVLENTEMRNKSTSDFEKQDYKSKNNAIFGKVTQPKERLKK